MRTGRNISEPEPIDLGDNRLNEFPVLAAVVQVQVHGRTSMPETALLRVLRPKASGPNR